MKKELKFNVFYYILSNKIIITSELYRILNENELYAILAHEEGHKKDRIFYLAIGIIGFTTLVTLFSAILLLIKNNLDLLSIIIILLCFLILFLLLNLYKHLEYKADEYSSKKINCKYLISGLAKLRKYAKYDEYLRYKILERLTKPSYMIRIKRLKNNNRNNQKNLIF